ncbi:hypothetical protein P261_02330 [Lachnospiraceae bacterium TWA4]|nr:hypothetical protein P261_02330 [Lachnospiraceae bacterium TWA4]
MPLPYNREKTIFARKLRNNATKQENHLWYDFLRTYPIKFERQKVIGEYIADFYSYSAHLVIELDGSQHYTDENIKYDSMRTKMIEKYDLDVVRFSNNDVDKSFEGVCKRIDLVVKQKIKQYKN